MAVKYKIKKGDEVKVIAGDDKGKVAKKAVKPSEKNPNGGFISKEMPIDISNVSKVEG